LEYDENIDGIIEAGSVADFLSKDIETYGIVKITEKGLILSRIKNFMMSEDHEYNESEDEAHSHCRQSTADSINGYVA
jgi:ATP-dependent DNA helicase RecQ